MARILILIGDKPQNESEGYKTYEGLEQLGKDEYAVARYQDVEFAITPTEAVVAAGGIPLTGYDLVYIRDFHGYEPERNTIGDYCNHAGIAFVNADTAVSQKISKLAQYMAFSFQGLSFPRSVYAGTARLRAAAEATLSYPMIVKSIVAKSGNDNHYVTSQEQFDELLATYPDVKFIAQEAIPNDGDYRVIVLGDRASCVYRRVAQSGDHRNNISQGGEKQYLPLEDVPAAITELAVAASRALGRDICGADIMINQRTDQPVVLEANFNFGIRAVPGVLSEELYGLAEYLHTRATSRR